jgi:glutamate racemase
VLHIINFVSIGFIDSGIGGLTTLRECKKAFPKANFIYIADTKYAPYGIKSKNFLTGRSYELVKELVKRGADAVVFACNSCSVATCYEKYGNTPIFRVLPDIDRALCETKGCVLLMATPVTIENLPQENKELARLRMLADKTLATKVEQSAPDFYKLKSYLETILSPYKDVEAVILGCTHYLYLNEIIKTILPDVRLYHSNNQAIETLKKMNMPEEEGKTQLIVTGKTDKFYEKLLHRLLY